VRKTIKLTFSKPFEQKPIERNPLNWVGLALPLLVGLLFWQTRLGNGLDRLSYDLLFLFKPRVQPPNEVVIVYMDKELPTESIQGQTVYDRSLYVPLLERLTADGAKLVVFDVFFDLAGTNVVAVNNLKKAIKKNGCGLRAEIPARSPKLHPHRP
jgi:CHASE2 domain-containing sensor protein